MPEPVVESLPLDDIVLDRGTQVRAAIDDEVVASYVELINDGYSFPPVVVYSDSTTRYLSDGFHRHHAYRLAGRTRIDAEVRSGTLEDAIWYALGANRGRGLQMSRADKRHAVELALKTWPDRSQRRIAKQVGCSHQYVSHVRSQVANSCHLPDRTVGADGKSYPAARSAPSTADDSTARTSSAPAPASPSSAPVVDSGSASLPPLPAAARPPLDSSDFSVSSRAGSPAGALPDPGDVGDGLDDDDDGAVSAESSALSGPEEPASSPAPAPAPRGMVRARQRSDRIMSAVVEDAQGLTSQQDLIDYPSLTREHLRDWRDGLREGVRGLNRMIRFLDQEIGNGQDNAWSDDSSASSS